MQMHCSHWPLETHTHGHPNETGKSRKRTNLIRDDNMVALGTARYDQYCLPCQPLPLALADHLNLHSLMLHPLMLKTASGEEEEMHLQL